MADPYHHHCNFFSWFQQEALRALWNAAFPGEELRGLISEQWKDMGWQGKDPSTDFRYSNTPLPLTFFFFWQGGFFQLHFCYFILLLLIVSCRGGGFISLENLLYFARNFPVSFPLRPLFLYC